MDGHIRYDTIEAQARLVKEQFNEDKIDMIKSNPNKPNNNYKSVTHNKNKFYKNKDKCIYCWGVIKIRGSSFLFSFFFKTVVKLQLTIL